MPRAVLPGVPHHLTQRGVACLAVFLGRSDYQVYLDLVRDSAGRRALPLVGYCLMPNHVHWVVVPPDEDSLRRVFGEARSRYAHYSNARLQRSGLNPVRAGLVAAAADWEWSSAGPRRPRSRTGVVVDGRVAHGVHPRGVAGLPGVGHTHCGRPGVAGRTDSGRPLGSGSFVEASGATLGRRLRVRRAGRPSRPPSIQSAPAQEALFGGP